MFKGKDNIISKSLIRKALHPKLLFNASFIPKSLIKIQTIDR